MRNRELLEDLLEDYTLNKRSRELSKIIDTFEAWQQIEPWEREILLGYLKEVDSIVKKFDCYKRKRLLGCC
ncbi:MAG: hypothetical protein IH949_06005 [Bacteroidetes bacterium]|nr:hypothetical protein [Bacteroidota bacterium]